MQRLGHVYMKSITQCLSETQIQGYTLTLNLAMPSRRGPVGVSQAPLLHLPQGLKP